MIPPPGSPELASGADAASLAIVRQTLMRELETVNQYQEAHDAASHPAVKTLLAHLMGEEKEHVAELTELLKRLDPEQLRLFEAGHAAAIGSASHHEGSPARIDNGPLTVGSLLGLSQ